MSGQTWPYYIELGLSVIYLGALCILSYGQEDKTRRAKFWCCFVVYTVTMVMSGALASGQMTMTRNDGVVVAWGQWTMYAITNPAVVLVVMMSVSVQHIDYWLGGTLGVLASLSLLAGATTPSKDGENARSALTLWVVWAVLFDCAIGAILAGIALGFKRLVPFPHPSHDRMKQGNANVFGTVGMLVFTVLTFVLLVVYTILLAVGPDGFREYASEWRQLWLTMTLGDFLLKFLFLPVVFYAFNADGAFDIGNTALRITEPVAPIETVNAQLLAPGAVAVAVSAGGAFARGV